MKTHELIDRLSAETALPALHPRGIGLQIVAMVGIMSALFLLIAGPRDDLMQVMSKPLVLAKTVLPAVLCLVALALALRLTRPERDARLLPLLLPFGAAAGLWIWSYAAQAPAERFVDVSVPAVAECMGLILLLSALPAALALRWLSRGASTAPRISGALAGLAAAAGAATGYSLFCVQDNPLFFVTWYGVAILMVAGLCALVGGRILRW
jgi:hypothetical protein